MTTDRQTDRQIDRLIEEKALFYFHCRSIDRFIGKEDACVCVHLSITSNLLITRQRFSVSVFFMYLKLCTTVVRLVIDFKPIDESQMKRSINCDKQVKIKTIENGLFQSNSIEIHASLLIEHKSTTNEILDIQIHFFFFLLHQRQDVEIQLE